MSWYALSKCKKLINCRTGKILKKTVNSGVIGWWIGNEFYSHNKINKTFEKCRTPALLIARVRCLVLF